MCSYIYDNTGKVKKFDPTKHSDCKFLYFRDKKENSALLVMPFDGLHSDMFNNAYPLFLGSLLVLRDNGKIPDSIIDIVKSKNPTGGGEVEGLIIASWSAPSMNVYETPKEYWDDIMQKLGIYSYA